MLLKNNRKVMTTETKRITQCDIDISMLGFIKSEIEPRIQAWIIGEMIDCRGDNGLINCKQAGDAFNGAGSAQQMTCHGLRGAYVQFIRMFPKDLLNGPDFSYVAKRSGCSVSIDVIYFLWCYTGFFQCVVHDFRNSCALRMRSGNVIGVCRHSTTQYFTI